MIIRQRSARRLFRAGAVTVACVGAAIAAACGEPKRSNLEQRLWTDDFEIRVSSVPSPPRAQDTASYTIYVRDKKTREPIVNGEGRIFATNSDRHSIWQGFTYGPEVGTYHARLKFITAGEWAMGVQFRRDSTMPLQQSLDWRQLIRPGTPLGAAPEKQP